MPKLSVGLLVCSAIWFLGAIALLFWNWYSPSILLIIDVNPILCLIGLIALVYAQRNLEVTRLDKCAFFAAIAAICGGILFAFLLVAARSGL